MRLGFRVAGLMGLGTGIVLLITVGFLSSVLIGMVVLGFFLIMGCTLLVLITLD